MKPTAIRPSTPTATLVALCALLASGCPWNGLEELELDAPVQVLERPEKFSSPRFGHRFFVLNDIGYERSIVVSGQYTDPLAVLHLNGDGRVGSSRIARVDKNDVVLTDDRQKNLVEAMVRIEDSDRGEPRVLVGVPQYDYLRRVTIPETGDLLPESSRLYLTRPGGGELSNLGGALGAGDLNGVAPLDWVVAEDAFTFFVLDENTADGTMVQNCPVPTPTGAYPALDRGVVTGRFFDADPAGIQAVALGIPRTGTGEVLVYRFVAGTVDCNATLLQAPLTEPGDAPLFGTSLVAADLNGDGADDLVVGSPDGANSRVFVFLSAGAPASLQGTPAYSLQPDELDPVDFGKAVGLADLDGDGTLEILVGDPRAPYRTNLGRVHIFRADWATGGAVQEEAVVGDPSPKATFLGADLKDASSSLGSWFGALDWGNPDWSGQELVVGASELLFVYFLTTLSGDQQTEDATLLADPR